MESLEIPRGNPVQGGQIISVVVVLQGQEDNKNLEKNEEIIHCKNRLAIFPSPAGISRTKLFPEGNKLRFV
jgi:hypothetical protein